MPELWEPGILLSELADEPELSEEFSAIFSRLKGEQSDTPHAPCHLVLSFRGVTYLNSSHIASILRMRKLVLEQGKKIVLCGVNDEVWSMLLLTGLDKVLVFEPDTMTALARIQLQP